MKDQGQQACTAQKVIVTNQDLPLSCPPDGDRVWDAHPKVYLPIEETGHETCPYCGVEYIFEKA